MEGFRIGFSVMKDGKAGVYGGVCRGFSTTMGATVTVIVSLAHGSPSTCFAAGGGVDLGGGVSAGYSYTFLDSGWDLRNSINSASIDGQISFGPSASPFIIAIAIAKCNFFKIAGDYSLW